MVSRIHNACDKTYQVGAAEMSNRKTFLIILWKISAKWIRDKKVELLGKLFQNF